MIPDPDRTTAYHEPAEALDKCGLKKGKWRGHDQWRCDACGFDTLHPSTAEERKKNCPAKH